MTAPSGLSETRDPDTTAATALTWTPGANGAKQMLYLDADKAKVDSGCPSGCLIKEGNLSAAAASYTSLSSLEAGRLYYWRLVNFQDAVCSNPGASALFVDSCLLTPGALTLYLGDPASTLISQVYASADISSVSFSRENPLVPNVSLDPSVDDAFTYQTAVTPLEEGTNNISGIVSVNGGNTCTDTASAMVLPPQAWWQAVGGDVHADGGNLASAIPGTATKPYLIAGAPNGTSGAASSTGSLSLKQGTVDEAGNDWRYTSKYHGLKTDYAYFKRILEDDPQGFAAWDGSQPGVSGVYTYDGDMAASGTWTVPASDKIVILVNGNLTVSGNINVDPAGFLAMISSGDIKIDNAVNHVEGVYLADGTISTGVSSSQLTGEGMF